MITKKAFLCHSAVGCLLIDINCYWPLFYDGQIYN